MNKLLVILLLVLVWIVLVEGFSAIVLAAGIFFTVCSIFIYHKFLPVPKIAERVNVFKVVLYPFYLAGQVYLSAFNAMKLIFTGADVDVVTVKTQITNSYLRTVLANSFTLTPGSISLDVKEDEITVLWLKGKKETHEDAQKSAEIVKNKLEKMLILAQHKHRKHHVTHDEK